VNALFVARTADASCYHRIMLPALALGCDWCGLDAPPPESIVGRGGVRGGADGKPDFASYEALVVQTPSDDGWVDLIPRLQAGGTKVFYEVDYDIHAFENPPEVLALIESLLELCDGVICATERIAERYGPLNANTHVCESGIDLQAYALTRPPHDTVNVGWAGRTLSHDEMRTWLAQVAGVLRARPRANFVSVGEPYGDVMADSGAVEPERCLSIPLVLPEQLPAAMSLFDIGFDPMGKQPWRRARSALRWLEASAWGIPFVGDRRIYPQIEPGVTGFHARTPDELASVLVRLIDDEALRLGVGARAREAVSKYSMEAVAPRWRGALTA
jgi:glycosyltransferase involved in cell wall biosynthesis